MERRFHIQNCRWWLFITFIALFYLLFFYQKTVSLFLSPSSCWPAVNEWAWVTVGEWTCVCICVGEWNAGPAGQQPHHCTKLLPYLINTLLLKSPLLSSQTLLTLLGEHMHTDTQTHTLGDYNKSIFLNVHNDLQSPAKTHLLLFSLCPHTFSSAVRTHTRSPEKWQTLQSHAHILNHKYP